MAEGLNGLTRAGLKSAGGREHDAAGSDHDRRRPGSITPTPSAPAAWSPPPPATAAPSQSPTLAAEALEATETMLQANPEINVIISINDDNLIGAQQRDGAGQQAARGHLVGFDGSAQAMQLVGDGDIVGAIGALPLVDIGETSISALNAATASRRPRSRTTASWSRPRTRRPRGR